MIAINIAVIFFISLDRFFKAFAFFSQASEFNLLGEILKFSYKANYYIAFSLPFRGAWLNTAIGLVILSIIYFLIKAWRAGEYNTAVCLFAIIMGAASNLYDRLKYGLVIDYLDLKYFTVFNLADIMITIGLLCSLLFIKNHKYEKFFS